jgi:tetratricopeptide (TPR) repeat protein
MIDYLKPLILDLLSCDERKKAWDLIDLYFSHAKSIEDYDVLGYVSLKADKRDTYLMCAEATYALSQTPEQIYNTRINLYKAYNMMNQPEKALYYIEQNLSINPDDFDALCQKASNISLMGDREKSEQIIMDLIRKYPEKKEDLEVMLCGKYLREGKLTQGMNLFLGKYKGKGVFAGTLKMKKWDGVIRPGNTIYIDGEGGIGDEIINIRFLDHLKKLGMKPILYSIGKYRKDTDDLFRRHGYEIVNDIYSIDPRCTWAPLMSLPAYLNLTEDDLWKGPYLKPLRNPKNSLLPSLKNKIKIGIKCSGNPYFSQDEYRKIPIETMLSYLPKDADIYYIDKEFNSNPNVINLNDRIDNWEDTLDFIDQMDCIVSSCTSLVHAAGAIGKTTFVAVPIAEYYIWTTSKRDTSTPWYGSNFHVMRQTKLRDWHEPLSQISEKVTKLMNGEKIG